MDAVSEKKIEWLRQYRATELECVRLQGELERWRSAAERATRAICSTPGGTGAGGSVVERAVDEIGALELALVARLRERTALRRRIERAVEGLEDARLRSLLRLRYIDGMKWNRVAEAMFYSDMQVMRLHREAVQLLQVPGAEDGEAA